MNSWRRPGALGAALVAALLASGLSLAQDAPGSGDDAPLTAEEAAAAEEQPLDLGRIEVVGETFTFEQELQLRLVRQALKNKRSDKREDIDEWVCWYEAEVGSRIRRLKCARNGDLWALRPIEMAPGVLVGGAQGTPGRGYGTVWVARMPVREKRFEEQLEMLPGSDDFDREFIAMAGLGERPPRDIPTDAEFDQFAAAYLEVESLLEQGADDDALAAAINAKGLEVARYNRIVDLIGVYQSLMNEVAMRIGRMPPQSSEG